MNKIDIYDLQTKLIEIEPGDMTRYSFIVSDYNIDYVMIIGSGRGPKFEGYGYRKDSIKFSMERFDIKIDESYRSYIRENKILDDPYIEYIVDHSFCNPWTAIAAILCANEFLK